MNDGDGPAIVLFRLYWVCLLLFCFLFIVSVLGLSLQGRFGKPSPTFFTSQSHPTIAITTLFPTPFLRTNQTASSLTQSFHPVLPPRNLAPDYQRPSRMPVGTHSPSCTVPHWANETDQSVERTERRTVDTMRPPHLPA